MITVAEVAYATYGALRLARFDRAGMAFFGDTLEAFWRSFYAAVIVAPMFAILVALRFAEVPPSVGPLTVLTVETISYVTDWVAFPFAMFYVSLTLSREEQYFRYMVAHNWSTVVQMLFFLVITLVAQSGMVSPGAGVTLSFAATFAILVYQWFIARVGLEISGIAATGVVLLDLIISIVLSAVTGRML